MTAPTNEKTAAYLECRLGRRGILVPLSAVNEVLDPQGSVAVPNTHPCVTGLIAVRGQAVPLVDLYQLLGYPKEETDEGERFIVFTYQALTFAFAADDVSRIHDLSAADIQTDSAADSTWVSGFYHNESTDQLLFLDWEQITAELSRPQALNTAWREED